jgi:hypothetical protein
MSSMSRAPHSFKQCDLTRATLVPDQEPTQRAQIDDDEPIPLKEACGLFPQAKLTVSTLRAEAARGRLDIFRLGKRDCTTPGAMKEMVRLCREENPRRASTSTRSASNGLSETEQISSALDAAKTSVEKLKRHSPPISARSTHRSRQPTR